MTLRTRLKTLEHDKRNAAVADSNAKHKLMQYLQTIADRLPPATIELIFHWKARRVRLQRPAKPQICPRQSIVRLAFEECH